MQPVPITVFTGFLGAGKTSVILSLLPKLPRDYKVVLLKNEFGDVAVDSELAKQSSLAAVSEILNGCMCCVLVGQMKTALLEIQRDHTPDRIIIECSGSAFPATLAFQIRELEKETSGGLKLDAIVTVVDAENFVGYEDTSPTAKMQSAYTDLILINKWEHVSERALDIVIDHLNTLNDFTPKVKCDKRNGVDPDVIFGLDSKLFLDKTVSPSVEANLHDEVETVTLVRGTAVSDLEHAHTDSCGHAHSDLEHHLGDQPSSPLTPEQVASALASVSKESVWRIKGFLRLTTGDQIMNWAFGRYELTPYSASFNSELKLTVMGERGEVRKASRKLAAMLYADML